jgi:hypothetical protein
MNATPKSIRVGWVLCFFFQNHFKPEWGPNSSGFESSKDKMCDFRF